MATSGGTTPLPPPDPLRDLSGPAGLSGQQHLTGPAEPEHVSRRVHVVVGAVITLGAAAAVATAVAQLPSIDWLSARMSPAYVFATLLVAGELRPIVVAREDGETDTVTVSTTFAMALVLTGPLFLAMLAQGLTVGYDDLFRRRARLAGAFNVGQYMITLVAARATFALASGHSFLGMAHGIGPRDLPAALLAGLVFFLVNNGTVALVVAAESRQTPWSILRTDVQAQGLATCILIGLAPVAAIVADFSLFTLPLVVLPLVGVQHNAHLAAKRQFEALHDGLTGLPNRTLIHRRTRAAIEAAAAATEAGEAGARTCAAVVLLDLDHFKEVNDTLGHHVGDGLLQEVARRIVGQCPPDVTVGRLGGDEFAVLVPGRSPQEVVALAQDICDTLRVPAVVEGIRIAVLASFGVALAPIHADTVETLFRLADIALYHAKETRGRVEVYREEINRHTVHRLSLLADLHAAVASDQLFLAFQPIVQARDGAVVAMEALLRWEHPVHGTVSPSEFIPLAEGSGIISAMSETAVDLALRHAAAVAATGQDVVTAVNLSARLLSDLQLPDTLARLLVVHGVRPSRLTVEVTESTIAADPKRARHILETLRDMGVRIAVDDFGTGYSSLSYLSKLRPDELKVDRCFVAGLLREEASLAIVRSTVELGHALGMSVTAEGVEDATTYQALVDLGCDRIQGYLVARPMPGPEFMKWLAEGSATTSGAPAPPGTRGRVRVPQQPSRLPLEGASGGQS